jgi:hypothetical protein
LNHKLDEWVDRKERMNQYQREWYKKNRDKVLQKDKEKRLTPEFREKERQYRVKHRLIPEVKNRINIWAKKRHERFRIERINLLGGKCKCCGENDIRLLCIDHVNDNGWKHKQVVSKGTSMLKWIRDNYPDFGEFPVQILCHNCNMMKVRLVHSKGTS